MAILQPCSFCSVFCFNFLSLAFVISFYSETIAVPCLLFGCWLTWPASHIIHALEDCQLFPCCIFFQSLLLLNQVYVKFTMSWVNQLKLFLFSSIRVDINLCGVLLFFPSLSYVLFHTSLQYKLSCFVLQVAEHCSCHFVMVPFFFSFFPFLKKGFSKSKYKYIFDVCFCAAHIQFIPAIRIFNK